MPGHDLSRAAGGGEARIVSGARLTMAAQPRRRIELGEKKQYRTWTVQQKLEIVLAGLRGDRSVAEVCREHQISDTLFYSWRDKLLEGGAERLSGKEERTELAELRKRVRELERTLGRKTYELEILGNGFRAWE